ncbi:MAG: PAS domain-containing protein [Legionella sp.]|nr:PAS domain-containing protein [Legionella sp.]
MIVQFISEQKNVYPYMDSLFLNAFGNAFCKDKTGKFLSANENELNLLGFTDLDELIGKDDRELPYHEHANIYIQNDQAVMHNGRGLVLLEPVQNEHKVEQYLCYKAPLLSVHGKTIGIFGLGYSLKDLISMNNVSQERIFHEILLLAGPTVEALFKETIVNAKQVQLGLSKRQFQCLKLLAKGMTYKQIALFLSISTRTVEHYIEAIKIKWSCDCRHTLVEKFIDGLNE